MLQTAERRTSLLNTQSMRQTAERRKSTTVSSKKRSRGVRTVVETRCLYVYGIRKYQNKHSSHTICEIERNSECAPRRSGAACQTCLSSFPPRRGCHQIQSTANIVAFSQKKRDANKHFISWQSEARHGDARTLTRDPQMVFS